MQTVKVQVSGINRSIDEGISTDGQCMELINARIKNGSVEPISVPMPLVGAATESGQSALDFTTITAMYYHAVADKYIALTSTYPYALTLVEDSNGKHWNASVMSTDLTDIERVDFIGNVAVFTSDTNMYYCIYRAGSYVYIGTSPELPNLSVSMSGADRDRYVMDTTTDNYYNGRTSDNHESVLPSNTMQVASTGIYYKLADELNKRGYFAGTTLVLVRWAFKLVGGGYIKHSPVVLIDADDTIDLNFTSGSVSRYPDGDDTSAKVFHNGRFVSYTRATVGGEPLPFRSFAIGWKPAFSLGSYDLSEWSGFISSVDVFVSPINSWEAVDFEDNWTSSESAYQVYQVKDGSKLENEIKDAYNYYKIAEFDLKGNQTWQADNLSLDSLSLNDKLEDDSFSNNNIVGLSSYVYNGRLHLGGIKETFFEGYNLNRLRNGWSPTTDSQSSTYSCTAYVTIDTTEGQVVVSHQTAVYGAYMLPYLCYPDARATKMTLVISYGGSTIVQNYTLAKHKYLNLAYYFNGLTYIQSFTTDEQRGMGMPIRTDLLMWISKGMSVSAPTGDTSVPTTNTTTTRAGVMKVSEVNNPISFPAAQTYQPSNGTIIGLCANTQAISQGQFGQYPLYAFCSDGIYSFAVGNGTIAYASSAPVSRDVCTSASTIKGIDHAVVFATQRGLMAITGGQTELLSGDLDGYLPSTLNSIPNASNVETNILLRIAAVGQLEDAISTTEFYRYLEGASVGYNYQENEIYVNNPTYTYAYCYNFPSGQWSKIAPSMKFFVNKYPDCLGFGRMLNTGERDTWLYDMYNPHRSIAQMMLLTRPLKFGSNANKRILQTALRGLVKSSQSDLYLRGEPVYFRNESLILFEQVGMYILGSKDGEKWHLLEGKDGNNQIQNFRDLVTKMNKSRPFKYFCVALVGGVRSDVAINYIEFTADEVFDNRLR